MEKRRKKALSSDTDKAPTKVGSSESKIPKTDEPLAEKDEVKQAEENMRKRLNLHR